ncbi:Putative Augmenter of liver regeneration [[Torrubiella] hemipterigena]|uniref:Sulfhydryl oxidase n=1 Tax=[Torrubiella] hemipterigena TaxID=1531966 RepID=A0A0A1TF71_9HYPO|nr:Putative Augmenter of liver regeneration [[Torrubiella] hemipterigena]
MESNNTEKNTESGQTASPAVPAAGAVPKKFPKGVVLDKDGKPCRSCTSFATWAAATKESTKKPKALPKNCPPDVEALGRSSWTLLHSIAATYPETPSRTQQSDLLSFVDLFSKLYPCWVCADDFQSYIKREAPSVSSRDDFGKWLCGAHNDVNVKLGKPIFDCSKWQERWRTGWRDGSCD